MARFVYDYYNVDIPPDCEADPEKRFDLAVLEAGDRARLYVMPCNWILISDDGHNVRVCHKRHRRVSTLGAAGS